jgi:CDP-glycerol glycerophosphotransferase (TagB/SpsB family)
MIEALRHLAKQAAFAWRLMRVRWASRGRRLLVLTAHTGRLTGNALGLAVAARSDPDFLPIFVGGNDEDHALARALGIPAFFKSGRAAYALCARADILAYTSFFEHDFGMPAPPRALKLFLWHGMPIKAIGVFEPHGHGRRTADGDVGIATSDFTAKVIADSFEMPLNWPLIAGEPKTDFLPDTVPAWQWLPAIRKRYRTIIAYVPTWREELVDPAGGGTKRRGDHARMSIIMERLIADPRLREMMDRHGVTFVARMHPHNAAALGRFEPPFFQMRDADGEATHLLEAADIVIADYSSLIIDALLFGKPIALWCEDYEEYTRFRPFPYFDFKETLGWAIHWTLDDLLHWLSGRLSSAPLPAGYDEAFAACRTKFHQYPRGGAAHRILSALKSRLAAENRSHPPHRTYPPSP